MSANNDFFVKFDSNATAWATQLQRDLEPARKAVVSIQRALAGLETKASSSTAATRVALARTATQPPAAGGGGGGGNFGIEKDALKNAIYEQADAVKSLSLEIAGIAASMKAANTAIEAVPGKLTSTVQSIKKSIDLALSQEPSYHAPDARNRMVAKDSPGAIQYGSLESHVLGAVQRAVKGGLNLGGGTGTYPTTRTVPSIATIKRSDLDRAGFDRVVTAIRAQTRVLSTGVRIQEAPANVVSRSNLRSNSAPATSPVADDLTRVQALESDLKEITQGIAQIMQLMGNDLDEAAKGMLDKLRGSESKLKAELAALEREATGVSRGDQSAARRAQAQADRAARPHITDTELAERQRLSRLIASPGASDFDSRLGRARTAGGGNYSHDDLRAMAAAFRELGIVVKDNTKTSKEELGKRLQAAHAEYQQRFPDGAEQLRTSGFNVDRVTKIGPELQKMLGDLNGAVLEAQHALDIVRADRQSGGKRVDAATRAESFPGAIVAPPGMVKGRRQTGAAIGDHSDAVATEQELIAAEARLRADSKRELQRTMGLARDPSFSPYGTPNIQAGSTPEEQGLANAARARVRDIRLTTTELDKMGVEFNGLSKALEENRTFIGNMRSRLLADPANKDLEASLRGAEHEQENIQRKLQQLSAGGRGDLFRDPGYQQGLARREGPAYGLDRNGQPIGERQVFDARRQALQERPNTLSDYRLFQQANVESVRGLNTVAGSKALASKVPGLVSRGQGLFGHQDGLSREDQGKLDIATRQLTAAQVRRAHILLKSDASAEDVAKAEHDLENAANKFANRIAKLFNGISPSFQSLAGFDPKQQETIDAEERRRAARETAESVRTAKSAKQTVGEQLSGREDLVKQNLAARAAADKAAAAASAEFAKVQKAAEAAEKKNLAQLNEAKKAEYLALKKAAVTAEQESFAAGNRIAQMAKGDRKDLGVTANKGGLSYYGGLRDGGIGPLTKEQTDFNASRDRLNAAEQSRRVAREQMAAIIKPDPKVVASYETARLAERAAAEEATSLAAATKRAKDALKALKDEIALVKKLASEGLSRKDIADRANVTQARVKDILGPARPSKAESSQLKQVIADTNGRIASLKKERNELRAQGAYKRQQIKDLFQSGGRDDPEYQAARARRARLKEIDKDLEGLGGGSGSGGRSGRTSSASSGGGSDRSLLAQILAQLKAIHTTLRGGVKVTGAVAKRADELAATPGRKAVASSARAQTATLSELNASKSGDEAERNAAMEAQRRRQSRLRSSDVDRAYDQALAERDRRTKEATKSSEADDAALRAQARAVSDVATATARLSNNTQAEVAELRRLSEAAGKASTAEERLAAQTRLAAQQARVAGSVNQDLERQAVRSSDRRLAVKTVLNDAGPKVNNNEFEDILRSARNNPEFQRAGQGIGQSMGEGAVSGFGSVFGGKSSFFTRVLHLGGTFIVRNFAASVVFGLTAALSQVMDQAIQAESTFVRVSSALEATGKDIGNIRSDLQGVATDYGVQLNDVYQTAAGLSGLFDNSKDLAAGTRIVAQLQTISAGALNATEATGVLASTLSAFSAIPGEPITDKLLPGGVEGVQHVADVLTSIQNTMGVNIETTAEGVSRMAGLAREMKLSFEETAIFTAQIAKQTNQTGAAAGEQFSRIIGALQTGRGRGAVTQAYGAQGVPQVEQALNAGDYGSVFKLMIANWDKLSDAQKRNVVVSVAGQRQAASFNALMNNGSKTLSDLARAEDANGEAASRMDKIMKTLNNRLARFGSEAQALASNLIQTGLLNFLGVVLVVTTEVLDVINKLLNGLNRIADNNGFLGFLRQAITLLLGAGLAIKAVQTGVRGFRGAIDAAKASEVGQGFVQGATRPGESTGRPPISRPGFNEYAGGRGTPTIGRGVGFALDRTVGIASAGAARGLTTLSEKLTPAGREAGRFATLTGKAGEKLSTGVERARAALLGNGPGLTQQLFSKPSDALAGRAAGYRAQAALSMERYQDQVRNASYQGRTAAANQARFQASLTAAGHSPEEIATRTSTPDPRLLRAADQQERLARVSEGASKATGRAAAGLSRVASSGALLDGAMIGVTIGILALTDAMRRHEEARKSYQAGVESLTTTVGGKTTAQKAADEYVGPTATAFDQSYNDLKNASRWKQGMAGLGAFLTSGPKNLLETVVNPANFLNKDPLYRELGIDGQAGTTQGLGQAQDLIAKAHKDLTGNFGKSTKGIAILQQTYADDISRAANNIANDASLSDNQKQAAIANLERAQKDISNQIAAVQAVALGAKSALTLSADGIKNIQETVSAAQSVVGLGNANGLDLTPLFDTLKETTGVGQGGPIRKALDTVTSSGSNSVDIAIANSKLLREEVIQLQSQWIAKLNTAPDEASDLKSQLLSALQQYGQASDAIVQALTENATLVAGQQDAAGNFGGAMKTYAGALRQAEHQFRVEGKQVSDAIKAGRQAYQGVLVDIASLNNELALNGFGPSDSGTALLAPMFLKKPPPKRSHPLPELPQGQNPEDNPFTAGQYVPFGANTPDPKEENKGKQERRRKNNAAAIAIFQAAAQLAIAHATQDITLQIAQTSDAALRAALELQKANIVSGLTNKLNSGQGIAGISDKAAKKWGNLAFDSQSILDTQVSSAQAQQAYASAQQDAADQAKADAAQARQDALALTQARLGVKSAYADARGDAVVAARIQVEVAKAAIAAARADLAAASTASETSQAQAAVYAAQAQLISANAAVSQAQSDLVQSQYDVSIALAEAAGNTVLAASRQLAAARAALGAATRKSGGKATAEVNQARAAAIQAEASLRDAKLQDELDTIDFNLQMGKITQSSAISALREILRTSDLTRQQRRQLLLQIKGMKDELANSQWNFGDIKLPTPYQMKRYIEQRKEDFRNQLDGAAAGNRSNGYGDLASSAKGAASVTTTTINNNFRIDGADTGKVKKIIQEVVGGDSKTRSPSSSRRR